MSVIIIDVINNNNMLLLIKINVQHTIVVCEFYFACAQTMQISVH